MDLGPSGRLHRWSGRIRRLTVGQRVIALLVLAVLLGVVGLTWVVAGRPRPGGSVVYVGGTGVLLMSAPLLWAAVVWGRGGVRRALRVAGRRPADRDLELSGPPIEQLAADLRRLLWRHDRLTRSGGAASRARWLRALEAAISARAMQAARALGVPHPVLPAYSGLGTDELRWLLRALAAEGLVLPDEVGLLAPGRH